MITLQSRVRANLHEQSQSKSTVTPVFKRKQSAPASIDEMISLVFGEVTPEQNHVLHHLANQAIKSGKDPLRSLILHTDQQILPSRIVARFGPQDIAWHEINGLQIAVDTAEGSVSPQVAAGYEPHVSRALHQLLQLGDTFIDVGANIGVHVTDAARIVGPMDRSSPSNQIPKIADCYYFLPRRTICTTSR